MLPRKCFLRTVPPTLTPCTFHSILSVMLNAKTYFRTLPEIDSSKCSNFLVGDVIIIRAMKFENTYLYPLF